MHGFTLLWRFRGGYSPDHPLSAHARALIL